MSLASEAEGFKVSPPLKIYIQDNGVWGCVIAVASSMEAAKRKMRYKQGDQEVIEHDIVDGFIFENLGDS